MNTNAIFSVTEKASSYLLTGIKINIMYLFLKEIHSTTATILLAALLLVIAYISYAWMTKKPMSKTTKIIAMLGMVVAQIQFTVGLVLYFLSPLGSSNFSAIAMKDSMSRLLILEHPLMMLLGIVLVTIGYSKAKRATDDNRKYKYIVLFYSIGLLVILSRIPWELWC